MCMREQALHLISHLDPSTVLHTYLRCWAAKGQQIHQPIPIEKGEKEIPNGGWKMKCNHVLILLHLNTTVEPRVLRRTYRLSNHE